MSDKVKYFVRDDSVLIKVDVESIEMFNYYPLKNIVMEVATEHDKDLIIDMFEIKYVDSTFLAVFVEAFKILSRKHKSIHLVNTQQQIVDLLKMMNLDKILNVTRETTWK